MLGHGSFSKSIFPHIMAWATPCSDYAHTLSVDGRLITIEEIWGSASSGNMLGPDLPFEAQKEYGT